MAVKFIRRKQLQIIHQRESSIFIQCGVECIFVVGSLQFTPFNTVVNSTKFLSYSNGSDAICDVELIHSSSF